MYIYIYIYIAPEKRPFAPKGKSSSHCFSGAIHINLEGSSGIAFPILPVLEGEKKNRPTLMGFFSQPKKNETKKKLLESAWQDVPVISLSAAHGAKRPGISGNSGRNPDW